MAEVLLKLENIKKDYPLPKTRLFQPASVFRALHGISLEIAEGMSFGIVGESGCGKSTLARIAMGLDCPTAGTVVFKGQNLFQLPSSALRHLRSHFQMVFQDPYASLNPRHTVLRIVAEPLETLAEKVDETEKKERVGAILREVGLNMRDMEKFPHEFSGGQRQRIAIARALITRPALIVADEATSALDVSVQAQVLNLMLDLQEKYNLAYLFISHNLRVVETITDTVGVLYLGRMVEMGKTQDIFQNPLHPYTQTLLAAVPSLDPLAKKKVSGSWIEGGEMPQGCPFLGRCERATGICAEAIPELTWQGKQKVACYHATT